MAILLSLDWRGTGRVLHGAAVAVLVALLWVAPAAPVAGGGGPVVVAAVEVLELPVAIPQKQQQT